MATSTLVTVEDYLSTSYSDGDRDFVDGRILERHVGENRHALVQTLIVAYLLNHYREFRSVVECRMKVSESRYRVPDVCLVTGAWPTEPGPLLDPPFLAIEVLSPDDRAGDL